MPIVSISTAPSRELYEQVTKEADLAGNRPDGLVLHAASELPGGEVQIVDVWGSAAAHEAFGRSRLFPAFAAVGVLEMVEAGPRPALSETFDFIG
jgi:hypothetical protein